MKVVLGLSGGVDSIASAIILKNKGYEVIALYFDVVNDGDKDAEERARQAAFKLEIPYVYKNLSKEFDENIIKYFCNEYSLGRTPIPCIFCNPLIKWKVLYDYAKEIGAEYIASGHYAKIVKDGNIFYVSRAANLEKDQSYMLARLPQNILSMMLLPLGDIESKDKTREIAKALDFDFGSQKESQDICFIKHSYVEFLEEQGIETKEGNYVDTSGLTLAPTGKGYAAFTIGQRKGLGLSMGVPCYVTKIDSETGNITVSTNEQDLYREQVLIDNIFWTGPRLDGEYFAKLRYAAKMAKCQVINKGQYIILSFDEAQRAPAPGQAAVIYNNEDKVVGCGIIC